MFERANGRYIWKRNRNTSLVKRAERAEKSEQSNPNSGLPRGGPEASPFNSNLFFLLLSSPKLNPWRYAIFSEVNDFFLGAMAHDEDDNLILERRRVIEEAEVWRVGVLGPEIRLDLIFPFQI